jgi:hypothetical protein
MREGPCTETRSSIISQITRRWFTGSLVQDLMPRSTDHPLVTSTTRMTRDRSIDMRGCQCRAIRVPLETSLPQTGSWMSSFPVAHSRTKVVLSSRHHRYPRQQSQISMMDHDIHHRLLAFLCRANFLGVHSPAPSIPSHLPLCLTALGMKSIGQLVEMFLHQTLHVDQGVLVLTGAGIDTLITFHHGTLDI